MCIVSIQHYEQRKQKFEKSLMCWFEKIGTFVFLFCVQWMHGMILWNQSWRNSGSIEMVQFSWINESIFFLGSLVNTAFCSIMFVDFCFSIFEQMCLHSNWWILILEHNTADALMVTQPYTLFYWTDCLVNLNFSSEKFNIFPKRVSPVPICCQERA